MGQAPGQPRQWHSTACVLSQGPFCLVHYMASSHSISSGQAHAMEMMLCYLRLAQIAGTCRLSDSGSKAYS
jgi:hypothetical protein